MYEGLAFLVIVVGAIYFSYKAGSKAEQADNNEEMLDAIEKAAKARDSIRDVDDARRLLMEHAVSDVPSVSDPKTDS